MPSEIDSRFSPNNLSSQDARHRWQDVTLVSSGFVDALLQIPANSITTIHASDGITAANELARSATSRIEDDASDHDRDNETDDSDPRVESQQAVDPRLAVPPPIDAFPQITEVRRKSEKVAAKEAADIERAHEPRDAEIAPADRRSTAETTGQRKQSRNKDAATEPSRTDVPNNESVARTAFRSSAEESASSEHLLASGSSLPPNTEVAVDGPVPIRLEHEARVELDAPNLVANANDGRLSGFDAQSPLTTNISESPSPNRRAERLAGRTKGDANPSTSRNADAIDRTASSNSASHKPAMDPTAATPSASNTASPDATNNLLNAPPASSVSAAAMATAAGLATNPINAPSSIASRATDTSSIAPAASTDPTLSAGIAGSGTWNGSNTERMQVEKTVSGGSTPMSRYQESKLLLRVLRGFEQLGNGGGQVRLRLHPPELGTLQLTLRIEGTHVSAQMDVENVSARDALLKNLQVLKDRLAETGLTVDRFDVQVDTNGSSAGSSQENGNSHRDARSWREESLSRFAEQNRNRIEQPSSVVQPDLSKLWSRTNGAIDLKV